MSKELVPPSSEEENVSILSLGPNEERQIIGGCDVKLEKGSFNISTQDESLVDVQCSDPECSCLGNNASLGGFFVRNPSFVLKAQSHGCLVTITRPPIRVHRWPGIRYPWRRF